MLYLGRNCKPTLVVWSSGYDSCFGLDSPEGVPLANVQEVPSSNLGSTQIVPVLLFWTLGQFMPACIKTPCLTLHLCCSHAAEAAACRAIAEESGAGQAVLS